MAENTRQLAQPEDEHWMQAALAQARLAAVKTATLASWSEMKETFSRSLEKLKSGVEHFRKTAA